MTDTTAATHPVPATPSTHGAPSAQGPHGAERAWRLPLALLALALALPGLGSAAEETAERTETTETTGPPSSTLGIDSLLRPRGRFRTLPTPTGSEQRGGRSEDEWRRVFSAARDEVHTLEGQVAASQRQLRDASSAEWGYSPTGGGAPMDPEVLKVRAQLKRDRQSLEAARARLRDLEVEASLSGVPDAWRDPTPPPEAEAGS